MGYDVIQKELSNGHTIWIEVPTKSEGKASVFDKATEAIDKAFDQLVQNEISEYCNILVGAFEKLKDLSIPPDKANAEFGIQGSGEGNVYLAKISANANFKISLEWNLESKRIENNEADSGVENE